MIGDKFIAPFCGSSKRYEWVITSGVMLDVLQKPFVWVDAKRAMGGQQTKLRVNQVWPLESLPEKLREKLEKEEHHRAGNF